MDERDAVETVKAIRLLTSGPGSEPLQEEMRVVKEVPLRVDVEGVEHYTLMCTPKDRRAMAAGFLYSEGILDGMDEVIHLKVCDDDPDVVRVRLKNPIPRIGEGGRNLVIVSSCGACGTEDLQKRLDLLPETGDTLRIAPKTLNDVTQAVFADQPLFKACGGTHAAGLFDGHGRIVARAEDAGRHNALDKAVGLCLLGRIPFVGCGAVLSGRVSFEMVGKCARAGIELICAVSAATSLAVEVAKRCRITLCVFVREDRATVLTHPHRVIGY